MKECEMPDSSNIGSTQACLSMLLLKLMGRKRLSHIGAYDREPGLGIFAGLNVLPKPTYMNTYSCRCSESQVMNLQSKVITSLKKRYPCLYGSELDLIRYGFSSNSGTDNLISDLIPAHYYQVSDMGINIYTIAANSNGLIYFSLDPGEHDITINILTCHADMDEDNDVDGSDLAEFAAYYAGGDPKADLNEDGTIDGYDLALFALEFGMIDLCMV